MRECDIFLSLRAKFQCFFFCNKELRSAMPMPARGGGGGGQVFVRNEDGSTLAIDVPASDTFPVAELLRLIEVCARPLLVVCLGRAKLFASFWES